MKQNDAIVMGVLALDPDTLKSKVTLYLRMWKTRALLQGGQTHQHVEGLQK